MQEQREDLDPKRGKRGHHVLLCIDCDIPTPQTNTFGCMVTAEEAAS
jgi:hypothetical protein